MRDGNDADIVGKLEKQTPAKNEAALPTREAICHAFESFIPGETGSPSQSGTSPPFNLS